YTVDKRLYGRHLPVLFVEPGKYSCDQDGGQDKAESGQEQSLPATLFVTDVYGQFCAVGPRNEVGGAYEVQEVCFGEPFSFCDYFLPDHGYMCGGTPETDESQFQEDGGNFSQYSFVVHSVVIILSRDQRPAPFINKKILPNSMAQSVLAACAISQKPFSARISIFVLVRATTIMIISGTVAILVSNPSRINKPQRISSPPTRFPRNSGSGKPIFSNLPAPRTSGKRNFCRPSDRKTAPIIRRISRVVGDWSV